MCTIILEAMVCFPGAIIYSLSLLLEIAQPPLSTFYYHLKRLQNADKYAQAKEEIATKTKVDIATAASPKCFAAEGIH